MRLSTRSCVGLCVSSRLSAADCFGADDCMEVSYQVTTTSCVGAMVYIVMSSRLSAAACVGATICVGLSA